MTHVKDLIPAILKRLKEIEAAIDAAEAESTATAGDSAQNRIPKPVKNKGLSVATETKRRENVGEET